MYKPFAKLKLMKGCIKNALTAERESCPANDHTLFASTPIVQCSGCTSATTVGPALHLPVPSTLGVAVGIKKAGPTPQISFPGFAGDMKKLILRSPRPVLEPSGLVTSNEICRSDFKGRYGSAYINQKGFPCSVCPDMSFPGALSSQGTV